VTHGAATASMTEKTERATAAPNAVRDSGLMTGHSSGWAHRRSVRCAEDARSLGAADRPS
jgi:hypothetical protein